MKWTTLICILAAPLLSGQILPDALKAFPGQTTALEYDNLKVLRQLPNYKALRQQYSGEELARQQKALTALGISENQLSEVVTAAGQHGLFGLLAGDFRFAAVDRVATQNGFTRSALSGSVVYCTAEQRCFQFSGKDDGRVTFGKMEQLQAMDLVQQGRAAALTANPRFMDLLDRRDPNAPVVGVAPGREIGQWVSDGLPKEIASKLSLSEMFSSIEVFGYSVRVDSKAHVLVNLLCSSEMAGTALKDTLSAVGSLEHLASLTTSGAEMPFENLEVNSNGRLVAMKLDAPVPAGK